MKIEIEDNKVYPLIYKSRSGMSKIMKEYTFFKINRNNFKYHLRETFFKYNGEVDYIKSFGGKDIFDYGIMSKKKVEVILTGRDNKEYGENHHYNLTESPFIK